MSRVLLIYILLCLRGCLEVNSQTSVPIRLSEYSYHRPDEDKESWQRLNLLLGATDIVVAKEGNVEHDTCLYIASRSMGLSRFSVLAEGLDAWEWKDQSQWMDRQEPGIGIRLLSEATGRKHLQLLLLLGSYYAFQPRSYYRYKDSVEYFLSRAVYESKLLKDEKLGWQALCLLGKIHAQANDPEADSIFNKVIDQSREAGDKETEARAFAYRGMYTAPLRSTLQKKMSDLQTASELYNKAGNTEAEINAVTDLGYMLVVTGQFQPAYEVFLKALYLAEAIQFPYTHYSTDNLAMVGLYQGKFGEPLRYTLQTINVAERCRDSLAWRYFYSRLAVIYVSEGRGKERIDIIQKAVNRFVIDRDPAVFGMANSLVSIMVEQGNAKEALNLILEISKKVAVPQTFSDQFGYHLALSDCYLALNKLNLAEMHIGMMDSVETQAEQIRGPFWRSTVESQYAYLFIARKQYRKAKELLERHFATAAGGQRTLGSDLDTYQLLITADSALGNHQSVAAHYKKYISLLDSSFRVTKIRQAEELQVMYETQEKVDQIAALNQQAKLEKDNLKQATLVKNLTLAGIIGVIIIAGLLYRQNRLRLKNNKVISHKNEQLQNLVSDKEWLLKEIHHRVKNNLQIIMSLLNSQSVYVDNDAALTAIHDSQRRVQAISLIHQKLYLSENMSSIDIPQYINELVIYLRDSFNIGNRIVFEQDIEPVELDVSHAMPLGLIVNEGIVNALKYAFPGNRKGRVNIGLQSDGDDFLTLIISDNGVGLPAELNVLEHESLGLSLMQGLAKQLNGSFQIENRDGLQLRVRFNKINHLQLDGNSEN